MLVLRIENDLGDSVDLLSGVVIASSYDPDSPSTDTETTRGGEISRVAIPPIQESISVSLAGEPAETAETVRTIGRMFSMASDRQLRKVGPRVWVIYQIHEDQGIWRSELMGGRVRFARDGAGMAATSGTFGAEIEITRRPWWESTNEQVLLWDWQENSGASYQIEAGVIDGDVETPATLVIRNATGDVAPLENEIGGILAGLSFRLTDVSSFPLPFQGELANAPAPTSTPDVGDAVGGKAGSISWTGGDEKQMLGWNIPGDFLTDGAGQRFRVIARGFLSTPSQAGITKFQARLSSMGIEVYRGAWVRANGSEYIDFGTVTLPDATGSNPKLTLSLLGQSINGDTVIIDYAMLMPCDNWAFVSRAADGVALEIGDTLIVDTAMRRARITKSTGDASSLVMDGGINLVPGRPHHLSLLMFSADMVRLPKHLRTDLEIRYRPRKSVL